MPMQNTIQKPSNTNREDMKISRLKSAVITIALGVKKMKLARVFVPAFAMMAIALGCIPAQSAESKIKIGVAMSNFDDVWLTYVRDAITKWASAHPDVQVTIDRSFLLANAIARKARQRRLYECKGKLAKR